MKITVLSGSASPVPLDPPVLCLVCRQVGHTVQLCPYLSRGSRSDKDSGIELPGELEAAREAAAFETPCSLTTTSRNQSLCQRCANLDILGAFTASAPFTLADKSPESAATKKVLRMRSLGPILTLQLLATCPLCRLLFDITYLDKADLENVTSLLRGPGEGVLLLVPAWTANRVERELQWPKYAKGKGPFARCLYTAVKPASDSWAWGTSLVDWATDAIGIEDHGHDRAGALCVKRVDAQTADYSMMRAWLHRCDKLHHATCRPFLSEGLKKIKLVDVENCKIVQYPVEFCDYVALSYVWGGIVQPSYLLGDTLREMPTTIEDAMTVTRELGKRYLWVDSVCIDQANQTEKLVQIGLMSAIYSGAWATIIAMSGQSARSGLPRISSLDGVIPQLSYEISGKQLLSTMPTLSQQVSHSPWVTRAWTFQEGLLSPRRLFFTRHQVYFECNLVQCCESLDDSESPIHDLSDEQRRNFVDNLADHELSPEHVLGRGVLRDPFRPFPIGVGQEDQEETGMENPLRRYMKLVYAYTSKKMTNDGDAIHAFSAVLTRLQDNDFAQGFLYGLPLRELPRALLWTHVNDNVRRRVGFPAWSWAGWEGVVKPILVKGAHGFEKTKEPPLRIWKPGSDSSLELLYEFNPSEWSEAIGGEQHDDSASEDTDDWEDDSEDEDYDSVVESEPSEGSAPSWITSRSEPKDNREEPGDDENASEEDSAMCSYPPEQISPPRSPVSFSSVDESILETDPIPAIAKAMFEVDPSYPQIPNLDDDALLIEGIIIQIKFKKTSPQSWPGSERMHQPGDVDANIEADSQQCLVDLRGSFREYQLRIYGGNAKMVIEERHGAVQDYLILTREHDGPDHCTHIWNARRRVSTEPPKGTPSSGTSDSEGVVEASPIPNVLTSSSMKSTYHGPLTTTFRRLKIFSLSSLTLTFVMTPFIFIMEATSNLPLVARFALAGIAMTTSGVSTALVAWCGHPYVTTLRWVKTDGDENSGSAQGLEMTTLTLGLHERNTRVYDTAFLVPTSRPFATWELAEAFQLPSSEVELARGQGTIPGEETVAETFTRKGDVVGRWIVRWDENGTGTCTQAGKAIRYFNVHQELLDRPVS
ncbi:uncharacterized protein FIBRA_01267 [Fibroporia radiculosa]|uniref:Heterokaryon incompatibility domain-containing protein n=1 Tax=Fibroporia radiculosa TaxID=599839 RepID=J4HT15_9APHY|nr:uncharacterized protein FIBRA_01267 [Fibroporia radiculosa]CCL99252.1 predicted protein [Fibroporia radiculosa]